jgi:hypothetical protein
MCCLIFVINILCYINNIGMKKRTSNNVDAQYQEEMLMRKSMGALSPLEAPLCASVSVCTRSHNIIGLTSCCYNALKLFVVRYICNKIYPNPDNNAEIERKMKITENQLFELISTSINFGSILNIIPYQGTQSLEGAIRSGSQNHTFDDRLISNMQWCYEAFTSQFGRQGEKIKSYVYSDIFQAETYEDAYINTIVEEMFKRSWLGPIPFVLMSSGETDHWFAIHCGRIISTWGIGDKGVDIKFNDTLTTPEEFANFIKSIKGASNSNVEIKRAALDFFKGYLKKTMLNFENARSEITTEDKINAYVDFYEGPLNQGSFDVCEIFDTAAERSVQTILTSIYNDLDSCDLLLAPNAQQLAPQVTTSSLMRTVTIDPRTVQPAPKDVNAKSPSLLFGEALFTPSARNALLGPMAGPKNCTTRRQIEKISNCGIINSCNIVKTLFLIFTAMGTLGQLNEDVANVMVGGINKLLYTTIDLSLLGIYGADDRALDRSLYSQMRVRLGEEGTSKFIRMLEFLQEFTIINVPQPMQYFLEKGLQPVSFGRRAVNNFDGEDGVGEKMKTGKEYFILCSVNPTTNLLSAVHYFICGRSESASAATASASASDEPVIKIYSAWSSDNVKNTYSTPKVSISSGSTSSALPNFRDFAESIEMQEAGSAPDYLRKFLMATMLNPDNEQFDIQTLEQIKDTAGTEAEKAVNRINLEIATITKRKLVLCTVPNYLTTLTDFIRVGISREIFNLFGIDSCISMSAQPSAALETDRYAMDDTDEPAETSEEYGGRARPRKNKITRRLRRHNRGKTMKKHRNNKRRANKVQTQRMVKRKKTKTTKLLRRHIVKK